jgi:hypothetical protein
MFSCAMWYGAAELPRLMRIGGHCHMAEVLCIDESRAVWDKKTSSTKRLALRTPKKSVMIPLDELVANRWSAQTFRRLNAT